MRSIRSVAMLALVMLVGCGPGVKLVPVSGTITKDGKPMAGVTVTFLPDPGNRDNTPGVAATGPGGNYALKWQDHRGVTPGKYRVMVTPPFVPPIGAKAPDAFKDDPSMARIALGAAAPGGEEEIRGEFDAEVGESGGTFDFDLKGPSSSRAAARP